MQHETAVASLPAVMNITEACTIARSGKSTLTRAIKAGALESVKRGRRRLITGAGFQKWISEGMPLTSTDEETPAH